MNEAKKPLLDEGGKSIVAVMAALLVAIFAFQLNASMLSPALVAMQNELSTTAVEIGNTQTVFFTAAALFSLFLPRLADLKGRRKVLCGMLLVTGIGCVISALGAERRSAHDRPRFAGCCWPGSAVVPDHTSPACDRRRTVCPFDGYPHVSEWWHRGRRCDPGWLACW